MLCRMVPGSNSCVAVLESAGQGLACPDDHLRSESMAGTYRFWRLPLRRRPMFQRPCRPEHGSVNPARRFMETLRDALQRSRGTASLTEIAPRRTFRWCRYVCRQSAEADLHSYSCAPCGRAAPVL